LHFRFLNGETVEGFSGLSLGGHGFSSLVAGGLNSVIFLNSADESSSALTGADVLNSDMNFLMDNSVAYLFVHNDTHGARVHVEDSSSLSVIEFVRHTLDKALTLCWEPSTTTST